MYKVCRSSIVLGYSSGGLSNDRRRTGFANTGLVYNQMAIFTSMRISNLLSVLVLLLLVTACGHPKGVKVFISFYAEKDLSKTKHQIEELKLPGFKELEGNKMSYGFRLDNELEGEVLDRMFTDPSQIVFAEAIDINMVYAVLPQKYEAYIELPYQYNIESKGQLAIISDVAKGNEMEAYLDSVKLANGGLPFVVHFVHRQGDVGEEMYMHVLSNEHPLELGSDLISLSIEKGEEELGPMVWLTFAEEKAAAIEKMTSENIGEYVGIIINSKVCSVPIIQSEIKGGSIQLSGKDMTQAIFKGVFYDADMDIKSIAIQVEE